VLAELKQEIPVILVKHEKLFPPALFERGIEVDKAKVEMVEQLLPPNELSP
jgi:hypothetical protein